MNQKKKRDTKFYSMYIITLNSEHTLMTGTS